jgi:UDP-N-acetylmuramoyl-tripeptide--D-alanyl-D-alanine ligase
MKPLTIQETIDALEGTPDRPTPPGTIARVQTDSRGVEPGDLFVAIRGPRFDGHDFVAEAFGQGAVGAVVRSDFELRAPGHPKVRAAADGLLVRVDDPVGALGRLARYYRRSVVGRSVAVVAVTGSNGKTTTKEMIAHALGGRWRGRASIKSFNNAIGVPLTLLSVEPADEFVICEVGTNAPGEIAALSRLIEPEVGVITGVSEAHLAGLGSLEEITREKLSLFSYLQADGCAVLNADCEPLRTSFERNREWRRLKGVTFGEREEADLRLTDLRLVDADPGEEGAASGTGGTTGGIVFTVNGRFEYRLAIPGRHNAMNALAAIAVARRMRMDHDEIAERLRSFRLPPMRLAVERIGPLTLINDAYNANPASLAAAVEVLAGMKVPGRRVLIVGDMRELGLASDRLHQEAGQRISGHGVEMVVSIGEHARIIADTVASVSGGAIETHSYGSVALARRRLVSYLRREDTILVKGSRVLELEKLVPLIREWAKATGSNGSSSAASSRRRQLKV